MAKKTRTASTPSAEPTKTRKPRVAHPRCAECGRITRPLTDKQRARLEKIAAHAQKQADKAAAILAAATKQLAIPGSDLVGEVAPIVAAGEVA